MSSKTSFSMMQSSVPKPLRIATYTHGGPRPTAAAQQVPPETAATATKEKQEKPSKGKKKITYPRACPLCLPPGGFKALSYRALSQHCLSVHSRPIRELFKRDGQHRTIAEIAGALGKRMNVKAERKRQKKMNQKKKKEQVAGDDDAPASGHQPGAGEKEVEQSDEVAADVEIKQEPESEHNFQAQQQVEPFRGAHRPQSLLEAMCNNAAAAVADDLGGVHSIGGGNGELMAGEGGDGDGSAADDERSLRAAKIAYYKAQTKVAEIKEKLLTFEYQQKMQKAGCSSGGVNHQQFSNE